ncbi:MAG: glycosyltransferase family 2 protein, partial [Actinomycetes bacterium]
MTPSQLSKAGSGSTAPEPAPYVSIILPCYNEQDHVVLEIERISAAMDASGFSYELLVIDDASTDA